MLVRIRGPRKGVYVDRDGVRKFFQNILRNLTITTFHTKEFITDGDIVVIIGFESGTVNATEKSFRNEWAQKYVVQNGLITEMEEYNIQVDSKAKEYRRPTFKTLVLRRPSGEIAKDSDRRSGAESR